MTSSNPVHAPLIIDIAGTELTPDDRRAKILVIEAMSAAYAGSKA